ncbi:MAG: AAA family ATPase [Gemmatimonadetes bacterium]|nr:AAA family ATPase [Gemmatimonadota bacterium]NNF38198.1 AAA family ATPase [Gemmatimonadota bacterium]NNK62412.1 AAA family ATPase [Gemmatimonadota bacterium]
MLRAHLEDAATSAAKAWSHGAVEPRHVAYAITRHFHDRPDFAEFAEQAKAGLSPRGVATATPQTTPATDEVLQAIDSPEEAMAKLVWILGGIEAQKARSDQDGPTSVAEATEAEGETQPAQDADTDVAAENAPEIETVAEVLADLDTMIGLESVKEQVRRVIAVVQANQVREDAGLPTVNPGLHLVFTGPPGTGKTTVARIMARLYAAIGALPGSGFTEVDRSDLVAGYVGQTAIKTAEVIRRTRPGVLFVDEAYSLTPGHASDFGSEAIATLVKAMEDHRDDLAVIVAGYGAEMRDFVASNPGLRSRLKSFIDFPDYDPGELGEIFAGFVGNAGLELAEGAAERVYELFERGRGRTDFGNARFARSLFEQAYARVALRAAEDGVVELSELTEITPEDLEWVEPDVEAPRKRIGFEPPTPP